MNLQCKRKKNEFDLGPRVGHNPEVPGDVVGHIRQRGAATASPRKCQAGDRPRSSKGY